MGVALTSRSASLGQLKQRQIALRDEAKTYSKAMVALNRDRAIDALKQLKSDKDYLRNSPFVEEINKRLEQTAEAHVGYLKEQLDFKQSQALKSSEADRWAVRAAFEVRYPTTI
jgi:hypothetical protein